MNKKWEELTQLEIDSLVKEWVLNWAWAKKGIDFDVAIENIKWEQFSNDAKMRVWYPHDYRYEMGTNYINKLVADFKMLFDLYSLLEDYHAVVKERLIISVGAFVAVILFWNKAFYDWKNNNSINK